MLLIFCKEHLWMRDSQRESEYVGCGSFFCKDSLCGSDNQRPPPWMIGRRTAGTTRGLCRSGRQRTDQPRGRFTHWTWSRRPAPEPQRQQARQGLFIARLAALASQELAALLPLPPGGLPRLVPAPIADGIAQRKPRIDVVSAPAHPCSFEPCFHDHFVGT